ncbi:KamA family radical SAM protein [Singulisphaera acidiphila]|uniref:KamA family protein n=1 Tax=Singulisphaera acidiphila (strain ATCC BAA-1392 / DSM 18658 / VKM B-2454 / MOB10) TaxID=886293 RepID=L0DM16_SINAD|nr:KamA family radical SAM protein [Singulisphaera acidiphila]AGA30302.1 KamA family protein [Singulisphaera acidiphila DSM 18658]
MGEPSSSTSTAVTIPDAVEVADGDEPPSSTPQPTPRHPVWADVPDADWNDWHWQSQHAVRHPRQILDLIPFTEAEQHAIESLQAQYKLAIPPYYFSLIDRFDPLDPIRLQSVPSPLEMTGAEGEEDPLDEDKDSPVPGLTHRYPDRALLVTTHVCTMYCRFCTRKRATMKRGGWDSVSRSDQRMVEYVRDHPEIHDVIVSGGDPLTLPLEKLAYFVESLSAIPHLDVIRIGTRVPVTLPQRLEDNDLLDILESSGKIWIQTHFNHPREVTSECRRACDRLRMRGLPINNHAVLLKGVNDSLATQRALCRALLRIKVRPYYLFHCDPVTGAGHFRTPVWKGIEIIEGLRGHISGLGVPTYVVDAPRGGGKIPLMPNYLLSATNDSVVLRNYEGMIVNYHPTGEPPLKQEVVETQGVSALLEGQAEVLIPEGNPRLSRRRARGIANGLSNGHGPQGPSPKKSPGRSGNGRAGGAASNGNGQGHTPAL